MNMKTDICSLFNIKYPIIQAGMAGGITTAELVAGVSNAGGLGVLGAGYLTPEATKKAIKEIKSRTDKPFAVNIFRVNKEYNDSRTNLVQGQLDYIYDELNLSKGVIQPEVVDHYSEQFEVLLDEKVPVISTTFGPPSREQVKKAHLQEIKLITMVTTVGEAIQVAKVGVDAVVAQGGEAGGHRGTFDVNNRHGAVVGTFALVPQVVDYISIPVIAAGGIMDGRGLIAAVALGAQGIQMGTRFLTAVESGTDQVYKEALLESDEESTTITSVFSGRPARAIHNQFINHFEKKGIQPLSYPIQNILTKNLRAAAKKQGKSEYMSLWAGQGNRLVKNGQTVKEIIDEIVKEAYQSQASIR